jgi:hypothetical protein
MSYRVFCYYLFSEEVDGVTIRVPVPPEMTTSALEDHLLQVIRKYDPRVDRVNLNDPCPRTAFSGKTQVGRVFPVE